MLDAGENAAPIAAVQSLVNNSVDFDIHSFAADDPVVDAAKEIEQPALVEDAWVRRSRRTRQGVVYRIVATPCFRFVHRGSPERASIIFLSPCLENSFRGVKPGEDKLDFPALPGDEDDLVLIVCAEGELPVAALRHLVLAAIDVDEQPSFFD